jgi:alpha-methylacyl-CoA racemase
MIRALEAVKVLEFEGIGPGPLAGRLLADMGAEVTVIARRRVERAADRWVSFYSDAMRRGKRVLTLDLKDEEDLRIARAHIESTDALIEGFRPGVMERLGLGPAHCAHLNRRLVYGRMTGWGQEGPLAHAAGHDLNYLALSGALMLGAVQGAAPRVPPTVMGDGAGALGLAFGITSGLLAAARTERGCVVDCAIVDVAACLSAIALTARNGGLLDGPAPSVFHDSPFYDVYRCADGRVVSIGALEPQFYALLLRKLGLEDVSPESQYDAATWPALKQQLVSLFARHPRDHWCALLEGSDACFAPVLSPDEASQHPHNRARRIFRMSEAGLDTEGAPRIRPLPDETHLSET